MSRPAQISALLLGVVLLFEGAACAGAHRPPTELLDARVAYARAWAGHAPQLAPASLDDAQQALALAERAELSSPGSNEARDLAYVALRKTLVAEANARSALAAAQAAEEMQAMTLMRRAQLADAENRAERFEDKTALGDVPQSGRSAKAALDRLTPFAVVREKPGGLTMSLEGSVLFDGSSADLLPTARERLDRVAEALREVRAPAVVVRGYVQRSGDDRRDAALSRRRAETVRQYLIAREIQADHVRAEGLGRSSPRSGVGAVDGREDNAGIEVVVEGLRSDATKR